MKSGIPGMVARAALLVAIAMAPAARAATVAFSFGGVVQTVLDSHGVLDGSITPGSRLSGQARYETELTDLEAGATMGRYLQPVPPGSFSFDLGSYHVVVPSFLTLLVYDDFFSGRDTFAWRHEGATFPIPGVPGASFNLVSVDLDTTNDGVLTSDALPSAPLDLADFPDPDVTRFGITGCLDTELDDFFCVPDETIAIYGVIDTLPEANATAAAFAALATLACLAGSIRRA